MPHRHLERHRTRRTGWLRAAVLGANDGIVSTAEPGGRRAAARRRARRLLAGVAGLVAGAMSMAAGEYVSVSSQADTEEADLARERAELGQQPECELEELRRFTCTAGSIRSSRPGRRATDGARRTRRPCARRTGHHRDAARTPDTGGAGVGGDVRRRGGAAAPGRRAGARAPAHRRRLGQLARRHWRRSAPWPPAPAVRAACAGARCASRSGARSRWR